jgi:hypothetical protein
VASPFPGVLEYDPKSIVKISYILTRVLEIDIGSVIDGCYGNVDPTRHGSTRQSDIGIRNFKERTELIQRKLQIVRITQCLGVDGMLEWFAISQCLLKRLYQSARRKRSARRVGIADVAFEARIRVSWE